MAFLLALSVFLMIVLIVNSWKRGDKHNTLLEIITAVASFVILSGSGVVGRIAAVFTTLLFSAWINKLNFWGLLALIGKILWDFFGWKTNTQKTLARGIELEKEIEALLLRQSPDLKRVEQLLDELENLEY